MLIDLEHWHKTLTDPRTLWIGLWLGVAFLTIALMVVSRTRWGQARPTSKCVVLSVFAHLLLIGYGYKTQISKVYPTHTSNDSIRVTWIAQEEAEAPDEKAAFQEEAWNRFAPSEFPEPGSRLPLRHSVEEMFPDLEREPTIVTATSSIPATIAVKTSESSQEALPKPLEMGADEMEAVRDTVVSADSIEPSVEQRSETRPVGGNRDVVDPALPAGTLKSELPGPGGVLKRESVVPGLPRSQQELTQLVQRLAELPNTPEKAAVEHHVTDDLDPAEHGPGHLAHADVGEPGPIAPRPSPGNPVTVPGNGRTEAVKGGERGQVGSQVSTIRAADGAPLPPIYGWRMQKERADVVRAGGGTPGSEAAVMAALAWLARNQNRSGHWNSSQFGSGRETRVLGHDRGGAGADADTAMTGLALLAFLGAGHTHYTGEYRATVQNGLAFLLSQQRDGDLAGNARSFARMYCHGIALFAICESFAMTGDERIQPYAERGVSYSVAVQNPNDGGWRYRPRERGDMSQFGWQVMALKSAELAGIHIPAATVDRMRAFLEQCSSGRYRGRVAYRPGEFPSRTMTAEGMLCRLFLYPVPNSAALQEAAQYVSEQLPGEGKANLYYWYYATLAFQQMGGERWQRWNAALLEALLKSQRQSGALAGSWDADTVWGSYGGRVYSTALAALCLESYYRYRPLAGEVRQARIGR